MKKTAPRGGAPKGAPKIGFVSLGCPKALVDSERVITKLRSEGYELSATYEGADAVVVNTCGFLNSAKEESLEAIGEALAANGKVIVTGCLGAESDRILARRCRGTFDPHGGARVRGVGRRQPGEIPHRVRSRGRRGNGGYALHARVAMKPVAGAGVQAPASPLRVENGNVAVLRLFDVANAIDLTRAEREATGGAPVRMQLTHVKPKAIAYGVAPLAISLGRIDVEIRNDGMIWALGREAE